MVCYGIFCSGQLHKLVSLTSSTISIRLPFLGPPEKKILADPGKGQRGREQPTPNFMFKVPITP